MDLTDYLRFAGALAVVLALMGLLAFALKKLGLSGATSMLGAPKRLKVIEVLPLDPRRKAVLIQRDDKQHLVILGPTGETIVETGIAISHDANKTS